MSKKETDARYNRSEKGRARSRRYSASAKGKAAKARHVRSPQGAATKRINNERRVRLGDMYLGMGGFTSSEMKEMKSSGKVV